MVMMIREGRLERFLLLPFSIRCDSESSVALATPTNLKTKQKGGEENLSKLKTKKNHSLSKASFSKGVNGLIMRFKTFSQFFVFKQEIEEMEKEIEIGFPTDVKHVTHIGLDGSTTINPVSNWDSFPSISLQQLELAMAAQSDHASLGIN